MFMEPLTLNTSIFFLHQLTSAMKLPILLTYSLGLVAGAAALSWPPIHGNHVVGNLVAGSGTGGYISKPKNVDHRVTSLQVWQDANGLHAIQGIWDTSPPQQFTIGTPQGASQSITLADDEKITSFKIYAGSHVDRIEVETDAGQKISSSSTGGLEYPMNVGAGSLAGFRAFHDNHHIIRFRPEFLGPYTVQQTQNQQWGGSGGYAFSAVKLDRRVSKVEAWWGGSNHGNTLRKITVHWESGPTESYGNLGGANPIDYKALQFDLPGKEIVTDASLRSGTRTDQLYL